MALKKSSIYDINAVGNNLQERTNSNIVNAIFGNNRTEVNSRMAFEEINVDDITPRSINQYSQTRISRLAKSIRSTNDRLIHPIILVRPQDLPENHEVLQKFKEQGKNIDEIKYILVAGERRLRAWKMNREEDQEKIDQLGLIQSNIYDTITANVLSKEEAKNEKIFYQDSNDEARQLTPIEGMLHIKDALNEIQTDHQKRQILIEMNGGSEEGIPATDYEAAKKFNVSEYIEYYLRNELGIEPWKPSTIRNYLSVVNNCCEEVIDAILKNEFYANDARRLTGLPPTTQRELLKIYKENPQEFKFKIESIEGEKKDKKVKRFTHKDVKKQLENLIKKMEDSKEALNVLAGELGRDDREKTKTTIKQIDAMISKLKDREELFK